MNLLKSGFLLRVRQSSFFAIVEVITFFAVLVGLVAFYLDLQDRKEQRVFGAWQILGSEHVSTGGRAQALQYLARNDQNLQGVVITASAPFSGLDMDGAALQNARFQATLIDASFKRAQLDGAVFSDVVRGDFSRVTATGARWSKLEEASFISADLSGGVFRKDLKNVSFAGATLSGAEFWRGLEDVKFKGANLKGAKFDGGSLKSVDFSNADMTDVRFRPPPDEDVLATIGDNYAVKHLLRGRRFVSENALEKAEAAFDKALSLKPSSAKEVAKAYIDMAATLAESPSEQIHRNLGLTKPRKDAEVKLRRRAALYQKAIKADPEAARRVGGALGATRKELARILNEKAWRTFLNVSSGRDSTKALTAALLNADESVSLTGGKFGGPLDTRGQILALMDRADEAHRDLSAAIQRGVVNPATFYARGLLNEARGEPAAAKADFARALSAKPETAFEQKVQQKLKRRLRGEAAASGAQALKPAAPSGAGAEAERAAPAGAEPRPALRETAAARGGQGQTAPLATERPSSSPSSSPSTSTSISAPLSPPASVPVPKPRPQP